MLSGCILFASLFNNNFIVSFPVERIKKKFCLSSSMFGQNLFFMIGRLEQSQFYNSLLITLSKFLGNVAKFAKTPFEFISYITCKIWKNFSTHHCLILHISNVVAPPSSRMRAHWTYLYCVHHLWYGSSCLLSK